jgi:uncharacterized protein (DUF2342 family)
MSERESGSGWFSSGFEETDALRAGPDRQPLQDEELIRYGITEALREGRPIDDATARVIAAQLHGGQTSALCSLATTGAIVEGLEAELFADDLPVEVEPWTTALEEYLAAREHRGPVEGWSNLWPTGPPEVGGD